MVGIGGIGMSGIAQVLISNGFSVSGSDLDQSLETDNLMKMGALIFLGHHESHVGDADMVVYSSAIKPSNPELEKAKSRQIPSIPRALMLAELMRLRCGIAISGAHGKTTTTSLIGSLMNHLGFDPTVIIGGIINHFASNAIIGKGQFLVAEADESDGTFLHLAPTIAVVTNIDAEHLDYYQGGLSEICEHFSQFLAKIPFYGLVVACIDDPNIRNILKHVNRRISSYGFDHTANYCARNIASDGFMTSFDLVIRGHLQSRCTINMVGHHNVLNSLAAIAVLDELGASLPELLAALKDFSGVKRRFSLVASSANFMIIDDYAHHPTEIRSVLSAARAAFPDKKIRVLFQPHRFSRTKDLMHEFSQCFKDCDTLIITDIYSAQEQAIEGIDSPALINKITLSTKQSAHYAPSIEDGALKIRELSKPGDLILTLGAGSITHASPNIARLLEQKYGLSP